MCTQHPPITRHTLEEGFIFFDIESSIDIESLTGYELYEIIPGSIDIESRWDIIFYEYFP